MAASASMNAPARPVAITPRAETATAALALPELVELEFELDDPELDPRRSRRRRRLRRARRSPARSRRTARRRRTSKIRHATPLRRRIRTHVVLVVRQVRYSACRVDLYERGETGEVERVGVFGAGARERLSGVGLDVYDVGRGAVVGDVCELLLDAGDLEEG